VRRAFHGTLGRFRCAHCSPNLRQNSKRPFNSRRGTDAIAELSPPRMRRKARWFHRRRPAAVRPTLRGRRKALIDAPPAAPKATRLPAPRSAATLHLGERIGLGAETRWLVLTGGHRGVLPMRSERSRCETRGIRWLRELDGEPPRYQSRVEAAELALRSKTFAGPWEFHPPNTLVG